MGEAARAGLAGSAPLRGLRGHDPRPDERRGAALPSVSGAPEPRADEGVATAPARWRAAGERFAPGAFRCGETDRAQRAKGVLSRDFPVPVRAMIYRVT